MLTRSHLQRGLTVVETLIALAVLGIVTAAVVTTYVGSIRNNADSGRRTQSAQLLNLLGRRVAGGEAAVLPAAGSPLAWDYGELLDNLPELPGDGFADPDLYRATITNLGEITLAGATRVRYSIEVCTRAIGGDQERCSTAFTASVIPNPAEDQNVLDGLN
jgi:prepilin-type N-terminal cleavage/methylation domain-containing protein